MDFVFRKNIAKIEEKKHSYVIESFDLIDVENKNDVFLDEFGTYFDLHMLEDKDTPSICLLKTRMVDNGDYNYDDEWEPNYQEEYEYKELSHCPFTGEKINIIIKEVVDVSDIYNSLENELSELRKKYQSGKILDRIKEINEKLYRLHNRQLNYSALKYRDSN